MTDDNTDNQFRISRRRALAGLGTIGLASAGAGLGTSAFFSDQETFEDNSLAAGELDMLVDWEEHYSDWSSDEAMYARMPGPEEEADYVLPAVEDNEDGPGQYVIPDARPIELVWTPGENETKQDAKDGLWDTTSIEAFPDTNDDGIQDDLQAFVDERSTATGEDLSVCDVLADVGGPYGDGLDSEFRTTESVGQPLINLDDVKPGDFGEVTFSFHLCDNPGYVWMNGELVEASENGVNEPEASDPDEDQDMTGALKDAANDPDGVTVELLDAIATRIWYDPNGNNQIDEISGKLDIMLAVDTSGSINGNKGVAGTEAYNLVTGVDAFVSALAGSGADIQIGQLLFGDDQVNGFTGLGPVGSLPSMASTYPTTGSGNTPLPAALDIADQELDANGRSDASQVVVVFTDGGPNYSNTTYTAGGYTAPRANDWSADDADQAYDNADNVSGTVTAAEADETALVAGLVRDDSRIVTVNVADDPNADSGEDLTSAAPGTDSLQEYLANEIASSSGDALIVDLATLASVATSLAASVAVSEQVFYQGSLRDALAALSGNDGRGIPLDGDLSQVTEFNELSDPENDPDRDPFLGQGETHYVAFQWWLPINHANQIQSDSVSFDVGFYTEQGRHNDGAGMAPEEEATEVSTAN